MTEPAPDTLTAFLQGRTELVVSHPGRSQYSARGSGASACGLAALNCARLVLQSGQDAAAGYALLQRLLGREFLEEVLKICAQWTSTAHLDVEEIQAAPIFSQSLQLRWSEYERPGLEQFTNLLDRLQHSVQESAVLVITRPPEIVSVLKIATEARNVFVTFDSHPRKKHPDGAAFIFHPSMGATATYLHGLLQFDAHILADPNLHWQAQLLAHCSAHAYTAHTKSASPSELVLEASLEVLKLKAEISDLNSRVRMLDSDNRHLSEENTSLEAKVEDLQEENRRLVRKAAFSAPNGTSSSVAAPSFANGTVTGSSPAGPSMSQPSPPLPQNGPNPKGKLVFRTIEEFDEDDAVFATRIQLEWQNQVEDKASLDLARRQQAQFEEEDRELREQLEELRQAVPATFQCGICLEEQSESDVCQVDPCGHRFCRDCVLSYLRTKLGEHRFPILCPICATDRGSGEPGTITSVVAQLVGLTEDEYAVFTELELASFSVLLHCRKCQQTIFVDKDEYNEQSVIVCPLRGCNHIWCKACSRAIEIGGPPHSCDGSSELTHLMAQQGWKNCPGCSTPIVKVDGCNHMTCIAPGCNTHFCYLCGATIVQSVRRQDIKTALSRHYTSCTLIEVPPERAPRRR